MSKLADFDINSGVKFTTKSVDLDVNYTVKLADFDINYQMGKRFPHPLLLLTFLVML
jgi:hypothetical protein